MPSAICFNLDESKILSSGEWLNSAECRARSVCTYMSTDLVLHSPQSKSIVAHAKTSAERERKQTKMQMKNPNNRIRRHQP